jgi:hypothetical protein
MSRPTLGELKSLWLNAYSRSSLQQASRWVDEMESTAPQSEKFRALLCATVVAYARPFTQSQVTPTERVIPLAQVPAPQHLQSTHQRLLDFRHKVIGHTDATPAKGHAESANVVLFIQDAWGYELHTWPPIYMDATLRQQLKELCAHFVIHCERELRPLMQQYFPEVMSRPKDVYELVVSEPPDDWLILHRP